MSGNRHYSRIPFVADAQIKTGTERIPAHILDISLKGVLLALERTPPQPLREPFTLCIRLAEDETAICMEAVIRHQHDDKLGCEWTGINLDSMIHLRRLLELNLGDPALIERELHQLQHP